MLRDERYKLIYMPTRIGPRFELFDTLDDPAEVLEISNKKPDIVARLKPVLVDWMLQDTSLEQKGDLMVPRVEKGEVGANP